MKVLICQIGGLDCTTKFRKILTPLGVCLDLKLQQDPEFQKDRIALSKSVLGMIVTANLSDGSYGWHGSRMGLAVYYSHYLQEHNEDQEHGFTNRCKPVNSC